MLHGSAHATHTQKTTVTHSVVNVLLQYEEGFPPEGVNQYVPDM